MPVVAGLPLHGAHGLEKSAPPPHADARSATIAPGPPRMHLERLDRLPDLTALARNRGATDMYAELERLKRAYATANTPYRYSTPYRNPPRPCNSGTHGVPAVRHTLVNPVRNERVELWEAELHEAAVHGAPLPAAVVAFLGKLAEPAQEGSSGPTTSGSARETLVDRAMRQHGDFGVYGDVRAGLAAISKDSTVTLTDVEEGVRVDIIPKDGHGHELQFVATHDGEIGNVMAGESLPAATPVPEKLSFRFNAVQLVKQGGEMTLTVFPVWQDAQLAPPEGFENSIRTWRLGVEDFVALYRGLALLDFERYGGLADADFETTPPDLRHSELLYYSENGREVVNWGHSYAWLKDAALRKPLLTLEQRLLDWAKKHPSYESPRFRWLTLRDVQGLEGGRNVYVGADGSVTVQVVMSTENGLHERRYEFKLTVGQLKDFMALLDKHQLAKASIPPRLGIPDQARPEITLYCTGGRSITVAKWDNDQSPDFDAIYTRLLGFEKVAQKKKPVRVGKYVPDWRPD